MKEHSDLSPVVKKYEESKIGTLTAREKRTLNYFYNHPIEGNCI